jgi:hypothetical protein
MPFRIHLIDDMPRLEGNSLKPNIVVTVVTGTYEIGVEVQIFRQMR